MGWEANGAHAWLAISDNFVTCRVLRGKKHDGANNFLERPVHRRDVTANLKGLRDVLQQLKSDHKFDYEDSAKRKYLGYRLIVLHKKYLI